MDAAGGTGKTFCLNALLAYVRSAGHVALAVASSGIAALLLMKGRTSHSRFKLQLSPVAEYTLSLPTEEGSAMIKLLQRTRLIVWDEVSATVRFHLEALDTYLKDIFKLREHLPYAGITIVMAGDLRQTLPIERGASDGRLASIVVTQSLLWEHFKVLRLTDNMRLRSVVTPLRSTYVLGQVGEDAFNTAVSDAALARARLTTFANWQMSVGNGTHPMHDGVAGALLLPPDKCTDLGTPGSPTEAAAMAAMVHEMFPNPDNVTSSSSCAILAPRVADVNIINDLVLARLAGDGGANMFPRPLPFRHLGVICVWTWRHVSSTRNSCLRLACPSSTRLVVLLLSADSLVEPGADGMSPGVEYLHGETHGGMARHDLTLKVGALVMLTHNLKPADGLCNGTRLIVTKIPASRRCIVCRKFTPDDALEDTDEVLIPRIIMRADENVYPFKWQRVQFPLRVAFAMTINKSHGQTLDRVAVYLPMPCFAHGQLYVAISRVRDPDGLRFWLPARGDGVFVTNNVVIRDVLTGG